MPVTGMHDATPFRLFEDAAGIVCLAAPPTALHRALPAEEAALEIHSAPQRRAQFAAGRAIARAALEAIGAPAGPILREKGGAARFPPGIAGSLAHCEACAVAAVADMRLWRSLGVDVEPDAPLAPEAAMVVLTARDHAAIAALPAGRSWDRLIFCAKECVHKCVQPLSGAWLEFDEVAIALDRSADADAGAFAALPLTAAAHAAIDGRELCGRWRFSRGCVFALLAAAADPS